MTIDKHFLFSGRTALIICGLLSFSALLFAYISQHFFGYQPCILCVYQRAPFWAIVMIACVFSVINNQKIQILGLILAMLAFVINTGIAFFHSGVERKFWKGFEECSSNLDSTGVSLDQLKQMITETPLARCDEIAWEFLGVSMANYNVLFCSAMALYCFLALEHVLKEKNDNKN